ncbi:MAG: oxygenase MpaB family protein [Actinomycetota bacterium]
MMIDEAVALLRQEGGNLLRSMLAGDQALKPSEMASKDDHGLFGPASVAWRVHGDSAMLIGGLRALLLQTLHPLAMAGVADHSDYRHDPWGRLHRTGRFIGATTFGSTKVAERMIRVVRNVHGRVEGTAPDGRPYSANDPHLLAWVHITEVDSFLAAYDRYGAGKLTDAERDQYVAEMAEVGHRLGAVDLPTTKADLEKALDGFQEECTFDEQAKEGLQFLLRPPVPFATKGAYGLITAASIGLLPSWAATMLRLPVPPGIDPLAIRPAALVLTRTIGWFMSGGRRQEMEDRLLVDAPD